MMSASRGRNLLDKGISEGDITQPQLAKLLTALQTEKVTVVIDTDHAGSFAGNKGFAKGVLLAGAKRDQLAADAPFNGFSAGVFTYFLTQYLWQLTEDQSVSKVFANIARNVTRSSFSAQEPVLVVKPGNGNEKRPVYFLELVGRGKVLEASANEVRPGALLQTARART